MSDTSEIWNKENVRQYLAGAYYVINGKIELGNQFVGLGKSDEGANGNIAFHGVIIGNNNAKITNKSQAPLIKVSNGSVVKDLTVVVDADVTLEQKTNGTNDAYFGYNSQCKYYGGIIGEIMGGDNIIDNSYVTYSENKKITLTGSNGTIVPVGGYVGVVVFGGVVFKNMTAGKTTVESTGINVVNGNPVSASTHGVTVDVADLDGKSVLFKHGTNAYMTDDPNTSNSSRHGFKTTASCSDAASIVFEKKEGADGQYYLKMGEKYLQLYNGPGLRATSSKDESGTLFEVTRSDNVYIFKSKITNTDYYINWNNARGFSGANAAYEDNKIAIEEYDEVIRYNLADSSNQAAWAAIYVNPLVGRVINGYAVNETGGKAKNAYGADVQQFSNSENGKYHDDNASDRTGTTIHTLKNGTKHYSIADIDPDLPKLDVTAVPSASSNGNIDVPNSQALFILSLITQSCAGTAQGATGDYMASLSYGTYSTKEYGESSNTPHVYGISHIAAYSDVGKGGITNTNPDYLLASKDTAGNTANTNYAIPYIIYHYTKDTEGDKTGDYRARCVTSTLGFYDINLTGKTANGTPDPNDPGSVTPLENYTYILPDSFRGLGSVGNYDSLTTNAGRDNKFSMKVDVFDGKGCTIDEDIYLNKYQTDNYFNVLHSGASQSLSADAQRYLGNATNGVIDNHGIGLFDSLIAKPNSGSLRDFVLKGSVNTEIYINNYSTKNQKWEGADTTKEEAQPSNGGQKGGAVLWLSVGGVCGWMTNGTVCSFTQISLNNLTVSGADFVGGLLGFSGLSSNSDSVHFTINQCSAEDISIRMSSSKNIEDTNKARNAIGGFVGKVQEAAVYIYGTASGNANNNLNDYSTVKLKAFDIGNGSTEYYVCAGGLVGFAGNGCKVYDMLLTHSDGQSESVTIGNDKTRFAGGFVGAMQSQAKGGKTGVAVFKNCTLQEINVNGNYAGGYYGGKWDSEWTTYSITLDNCKMIGDESTHNTVYGNGLYGDNNQIGYAGGFVGRLYPYTNKDANDMVTHNVLIKDCVVSNYDITAVNKNNSTPGYAGGFIGYASSATNSVTCYIHDSSVENCKIGASDNYAGGAVGRIIKKPANKILGYNIKLDNITSDAGDKMGTWIGFVDPTDNATSIQFSGVAIYGNGFSKNVGNRETFTNASFVFASYIEANNTADTTLSGFHYSTDTNVEMPKYPYVNVNPQSGMGTGEYISGDGAVLYNGQTMAQHIYSELSNTSNTRRYTTFTDSDITDGKKISAYLNDEAGGDRISTFKKVREIVDVDEEFDDFAVVVIANSKPKETTKLINRYIQLVTNTSTDYTLPNESNFTLDLKQCVFKDGKFVINEEAASDDLPIRIETDSEDPDHIAFRPEPANADSLDLSAYKFTLLDVQYKDPLNSAKIAYHLYVPIYVIKEIIVKFDYSVKTGSLAASESSNPYVPAAGQTWDTNKHLDSLNTWVTQYLRYTYSKEEIQSFIDSGDIDWAHKKDFVFKTDTIVDAQTTQNKHKLPEDTYLILVDPNGDADKAYSATLKNFSAETDTTATTWRIRLDEFTELDGETRFTYNSIRDILDGKLSVVETGEGGNCRRFNEVSDSADEALIINGVKYILDSDNPTHRITVNEDITEDYYLIQYVPLPTDYNNELYWYTIVMDSNIFAEGNSMRAKVEQEKNNLELIFAEVFDQKGKAVYTVKTSDEVMSEDGEKNKIELTAETSISINDDALKDLLPNEIFHSFIINLNRHTENGVEDNIIGLPKENITVTCKVGGIPVEAKAELDPDGRFINIITGNIKQSLFNSWFLIDASTSKYKKEPLTITAEIKLEFEKNKLEEEFPSRLSNAEQDGDNDIGVNVKGASKIAYDISRLPSTSMSEPLKNSDHAEKYFHREISANVDIYYLTIDEIDNEDYFGEMSDNMSRYGVNGFFWKDKSISSIQYPAAQKMANKSEAMQITADAIYNVSAIENEIEDFEYLRVNIFLQKKKDTKSDGIATAADYEENNLVLGNYLLGDITITCGNTSRTAQISNDGTVAQVTIPKPKNPKDWDYDAGRFNFSVTFNAKTGEGFHEYANYKMLINARLLSSTENEIDVSKSSNDYIIYTNAKVIPTFIYPSESSSSQP